MTGLAGVSVGVSVPAKYGYQAGPEGSIYFITEIIVHVTSRIPYTLSYCDHFSTITTFVSCAYLNLIRDCLKNYSITFRPL